MDKENLKERIEQYKLLAEHYDKENKRIFVIDINKDFYFADILIVGEETLTIQCFSPEQRAGKKFYLPWISITHLSEYREKEQND